MNDNAVLLREFAEVDDLMSQLRGMVAHAVPLRQGRYAGGLTTVDLGDVTLQVVRSMPMLLLGAAEDGRTGLIQLLDGSERARWNGQPIEANEIAVCGGGQHEAIYPDTFVCTVLDFTTAVPDSGPALRLRRSGPRAILRADPDAYSALAAIARAVAQMDAHTSSALHDAEARRSLRAAVLDIAQSLPASADVAERSRGRDGRTRQRIVHRADEYLCANPARPVYTEELCTALGVSATRLHQAFSATFGISPHRYLKMRRMAMVRAALLSGAVPWHSVKAAALSHGFWHLGQFAHDYRALYGEAPSETLARALPGASEVGKANDSAAQRAAA
ncbi:MAG: helix-turn-helix domain-containing protein [Acetobacteraceae bacterium]|nr:helix-turn-helix domain-containing protein [Acetobacteraceae bacterium]